MISLLLLPLYLLPVEVQACAMAGMEERVARMEERVARMEERVARMEERVEQMEVTMR